MQRVWRRGRRRLRVTPFAQILWFQGLKTLPPESYSIKRGCAGDIVAPQPKAAENMPNVTSAWRWEGRGALWCRNEVVLCDGEGCQVAVHQQCYGISKLPDSFWLCEGCAAGVSPASSACLLCPCRSLPLRCYYPLRVGKVHVPANHSLGLKLEIARDIDDSNQSKGCSERLGGKELQWLIGVQLQKEGGRVAEDTTQSKSSSMQAGFFAVRFMHRPFILTRCCTGARHLGRFTGVRLACSGGALRRVRSLKAVQAPAARRVGGRLQEGFQLQDGEGASSNGTPLRARRRNRSGAEAPTEVSPTKPFLLTEYYGVTATARETVL